MHNLWSMVLVLIIIVTCAIMQVFLCMNADVCVNVHVWNAYVVNKKGCSDKFHLVYRGVPC